MRFPITIRHRRAVAKIYGKTSGYPHYRLAYYAAGKRVVRSFGKFSEAKREAERVVRDLSQGSQAAALSGRQAGDALAAIEILGGLARTINRRVTLLEAVRTYADAQAAIGDRPLVEAARAYAASLGLVKRQDLKSAAEQFVEQRRAKTVAQDGRRPALSRKYFATSRLQLSEFVNSFPGHAVCDLTKDHLNTYFDSRKKLSAKSRNDRRAIIRMFLEWCIRRDCLDPHHRLFDAEGMRSEQADTAATDYYRPAELQAMLEASSEPLRAVIALGGLAGVRVEEIFRLHWEDVWRAPGHVEITATKSKTRARRLVEVCASLESWLAPWRSLAGPIWTRSSNTFHAEFAALRSGLGIPSRRNGLRHAFCTYHFALHANENLTAALAGNSPTMIHSHYKGLATRAEAEKWFAVQPGDTTANIISLPKQAQA